MNRTIALVLLNFVIVASVQGQSANLNKAEQEVLTAIHNRLDALAHNDLRAWASLVADDMIGPFGGTKQSWLETHKSWPSEVKYWYGPLENVVVRTHGDTAIVIYTARQFTKVGGQTTSANRWQIETHVRKEGRWLLAAVADSAVPPEPTAIKVDSNVFNSYAGQYEWAPTLISTITKDGDKLIEQLTGQEKSELKPESETSFFYKDAAASGDSSRIIFVKDSSGRVTHYIYREYGSSDRIVKKIK
jgi:ketosteroid isomerase-like protein